MAPGVKKKLYKVDPEKMLFGVLKGSHVAHMFDEYPSKLKNFSSISNVKYIGSGYEDVSKEEVYSNIGEIKSLETFRQLAEMSSTLFDKYQDDKDIAAFCYAVKDYITADGRAPQQKALTNMKLRFENTRAKLLNRMNEIAMLKEQDERTSAAIDTLEDMYNGMNVCQDLIDNNLNGNLKFDASAPNVHTIENDGIEPKDAFTGKVGFWTKSTDSLFPHEPSPNDIKQGVGLEDCYCLSVLTQLAANDPEYIKNMLKDNNDGTVTVRFFTYDDKDNPEPVFVTVNKTVNKSAFGQDMYANSSLWVQMIEKAYAKYNAAYGIIDVTDPDSMEKNQRGMNSMWRGVSSSFMTAIFNEKAVDIRLPLSAHSSLYEKDSSGKYINHPDYYLPEEEKLFDSLRTIVNDKKKVVTTMPDKETFNLSKSPHDVGLRNGHVYTLRSVFEKDGKKFVQLRDPYGTFTAGYDKKGNLVNKTDLFDVLKRTVKSGGETMGTFNMELKDYLKYFNVISGVPVDDAKLITKISDKERNYTIDPITEEEKISRDHYDDVTHKQRAKDRLQPGYISENQKASIIQTAKEENKKFEEALESSIAERDLDEVNSLFADSAKLENFAKQVNAAYMDLKSTDEFYVLSNTKAFRNMRDSLKDLNDNLKKLQEGKNIDSKKLVDSIRSVRSTSAKYTEEKAESIQKSIGYKTKIPSELYVLRYKKMPKIKTASDRAFHRFTASVSINNICSYQKPLGIWPGKSQEALSIYRSDIEARLKMEKEGKQVEGDNIPRQKLERIHGQIVRMQERNSNFLTASEKQMIKIEKDEPKAPNMSK